MSSALRVAVLYPELLGTYGDGGNTLVLQRRLQWRGIGCEVVTVSLGQAVPADCDLYVLGGGEDDAQTLAMQGLRSSKGLLSAAGRGVPVFAVCAGMQLLGETFSTTRGGQESGLGLLDVTTTRRRTRAVGEVVAAPDPALGLPVLTGFENHGGGTALGPAARPLAQVVTGTGNGGDEACGSDGAGGPAARVRHEGVLQGAVVATYLHGPVLARNPGLADLLLSRATGTPLAPLPVPEVEALRTTLLSGRRRA